MTAPRNPNLATDGDRAAVTAMLNSARTLRFKLQDAVHLLADRCGLHRKDDAITEAIFNCEDPGEALRLLADTLPGEGRADTGRAP